MHTTQEITDVFLERIATTLLELPGLDVIDFLGLCYNSIFLSQEKTVIVVSHNLSQPFELKNHRVYGNW